MPVHKDNNAKKNKWYYDIFLGTDENGKKNRVKKRGFRTRTEAYDAMVEVENKINKKTYVKPSEILYGDYLLDRWLEQKHIGEQTRSLYESHISVHINPALGKTKMSDLNLLQLQDFINDLDKKKGLSDSTVHRIYKIINNSLKLAVPNIIEKNVCDDWHEKPKVKKKKPQVWDLEQSKQFLENATGMSRYDTAFLLPIYTGLRQGEVLGLRWSDVSFDRKTLVVRQTLSHDGKQLRHGTKTDGSLRAVAISDATIKMLKEQLTRVEKERMENPNYEDNDLIVCRNNGKPVHASDMSKAFHRTVKKLNMPRIRYHDLRHTHATLMLLANVHPKIVAERLGHSDIKITLNTYSHVLPHMQAIAVTQFDNIFSNESV